MDAYLKKEHIGTLFVRVGAPEGGFRGVGGGAGGSTPKSIHAFQKHKPPGVGLSLDASVVLGCGM